MLDLNEWLRNIYERLHPLMGEDVEIVIATNLDHALVEADPPDRPHGLEFGFQRTRRDALRLSLIHISEPTRP